VPDCQQLRQMCLDDSVGQGPKVPLVRAAVGACRHRQEALPVAAGSADVTSFTPPKSAGAAAHRPFR